MLTDEVGLEVTTDSPAAVDLFNKAMQSARTWRMDAGEHMKAALAADPDFAHAQTVMGLMMLGLRKPEVYPMVRQLLAAAKRREADLTERERLYIRALELALDGQSTGAISTLETVTVGHPTDLFALRTAQMDMFWLGESDWMRAITERAAPAWSKDVPGYGPFLSIRAFGLEEAGDLKAAERYGLEALEVNPSDCWGAHAVAHVLEMQARHGEGISLLDGLKDNWAGANHIIHHLWWHHCLFQVENGDYDGALAVYDDYVRNPDSPLVKAIPDMYFDIQNGASLLLRLELRGVGVGTRWEDIADISEGRLDNRSNVFTCAHCAIALARSGRYDKAETLLGNVRTFAAAGEGTFAPIYKSVAAPVIEAVIAHSKGENQKVVDLLMPVRRGFRQMGGSHAQRDIFYQVLADAAAKLGRKDILTILIGEVRGLGFQHIEDRSSYAGAVETVQ